MGSVTTSSEQLLTRPLEIVLAIDANGTTGVIKRRWIDVVRQILGLVASRGSLDNKINFLTQRLLLKTG